MPADLAAPVRLAATALAVATPFLTHYLIVAGRPAPFAGALVVGELAVAGAVLWWTAGPTVRLVGLAMLAASIAVWSLQAAPGIVVAAFTVHAGIYTALLALFGASLRRGREPIVTFFARLIHGAPSAETRVYTRRVTIAWCLFFGFQIALSAALLAAAPIGWWSAYVNLLNLPLTAAFFLGERLARPLWLVDAPREGIADIVRMGVMVKDGLLRRAAI